MLRRSGGSECARRGDQLVADADFAAARLDEAGDQPQRRGLAAARGAEQADQMAVPMVSEISSTTATSP